MKDIENLLQRYQEGDLDSEGLAELNRLTHRDRVLQAASRQAQAIHRRRQTAVIGVVAVLVVVGVVFLTLPKTNNTINDSPIMAKTEVPTLDEAIANTQTEVVQTESPRAVSSPVSNDDNEREEEVLKPESVQAEQVEQPVVVESVVEHHEPAGVSDPIVACNTQCSPDSVINDIWKFLRT